MDIIIQQIWKSRLAYVAEDKTEPQAVGEMADALRSNLKVTGCNPHICNQNYH